MNLLVDLCRIRLRPTSSRKSAASVNARGAGRKCRVETDGAGTTRRTPPVRQIRQLPDRPHDDRPARGVKTRRALRQRTVVAFHEEMIFYQQ